jgi:hypothetical protein
MKKFVFLSLTVVIVLSLLFGSCTNEVTKLPFDPYIHPQTGISPSPTSATPYTPVQSPMASAYAADVISALSLNSSELALLQQNRFVVTDRLSWDRFLDAYAWIYWKDLPVLVTTNSILHSVHQSYDAILMDIERSIIIPNLQELLLETDIQVANKQSSNKISELNSSYQDVSTYLEVAQALLTGKPPATDAGNALYKFATDANSYQSISLFGSKRTIDFTLFKPRGHYTTDTTLSQYFRSMNWLAQIDFRFVEYDPASSKPIFRQSQVVAAAVFRDALSTSGARNIWEQIDQLLKSLVGASDNTTLNDFDKFMNDMHYISPQDVVNGDAKQMLAMLLNNDYGYQRITGQLIARDTSNFSDQPVPRPISFMLMGQRFSIDSYVLGNLAYDRMIGQDKTPIKRALPSSLDVMYSLGNNNALTHLADEIQKYDYQPQLSTMCSEVDSLTSDFWSSSFYNHWLGMIRTLNTPTTDNKYPEAFRTNAWADKMLQTQLASWAQLRHDNLLYVKQSFSSISVCSYPRGYVEPYPDFYTALYDYAQAGNQALSSNKLNSSMNGALKKRIMDYFQKVMTAAKQLKVLSEKELALQSFTTEEEDFLKSVVRNRSSSGCAGTVVTFDGWYVDLFYNGDDNSAVIADVHTNPNLEPPLGPPSVLHAATGAVVPICLAAETDEGSTMYVGPCFTYYDVIEGGNPPTRLTDKDWQARVKNSVQQHPTWTQSFLVSSGQKADGLKVIASMSLAAGATNVPLTPTINFYYVPNATGYDFKLATDPAFTQIVDSIDNTTALSYTPSIPLKPNTQYYWEVRARNGTNFGDWVQSAFTTEP